MEHAAAALPTEIEHPGDSGPVPFASGSSTRDAGQLYPVAKAILEPIFKLLWRVEIQGAQNIPRTGPAILCPNHTSVIDSFLLPFAAGRRVTFVGKAEYMDDWKTKWLFPQLGMIPIDRGGGDAAERALAAAQRILEWQELFGIYPEGTRSRDGRLYRGHTGPARLALRTGAPIVPVGILGSAQIQPAGRSMPYAFRHAIVRFGKPVDPARYKDRPHDHLVYRQITDEVMFEIRELSGQAYVDTYATKKAEALPTAQVRAEDLARAHDVPAQDVTAKPARRSSADVLGGN